MAAVDDQTLQAWTCVKCGAALPAEASAGEFVTCSHCGTSFSMPKTEVRDSGVNISGESIFIGGDVIGGSVIKIVAYPPAVKSEPSAPQQSELAAVAAVAEKSAAPEILVQPTTSCTPEVVPTSEPKRSWLEKIKQWLSN